MLIGVELPTYVWGHPILHVASLVRTRPTTYPKYLSFQLAYGQELNISHFWIFGCTIYVPIIAPQQCTKMGPQMRLGIYVGFDSPSIIKYLEPLTDDVFTTQFADCHFNETNFSTLGKELKSWKKKLHGMYRYYLI